MSMHQHPPEGLFKYRLLGPTVRVSDSEGLDWVLITCIFYKFLAAAAAAGLGPHSGNY